jgi:hypothetical protein
LTSELENLKKEKELLDESVTLAINEYENLLEENNEKTVQLESLGEEEQKLVFIKCSN